MSTYELFEFTAEEISVLSKVKKIVSKYNSLTNYAGNKISYFKISDTEIAFAKKNGLLNIIKKPKKRFCDHNKVNQRERFNNKVDNKKDEEIDCDDHARLIGITCVTRMIPKKRMIGITRKKNSDKHHMNKEAQRKEVKNVPYKKFESPPLSSPLCQRKPKEIYNLFNLRVIQAESYDVIQRYTTLNNDFTKRVKEENCETDTRNINEKRATKSPMVKEYTKKRLDTLLV
ncbi:hypothetical protein RhiirA5_384741 [Rhizophagus irregularis]|uniref:Uncharacterized protein n=1 Tax=Rhizophagus irregularis TaxID=588596 RepID=A0A2N0NRX6_9GLOM|nr:hypothetical protein RhiirA5_384741 [Rhizophagus irregularis]